MSAQTIQFALPLTVQPATTQGLVWEDWSSFRVNNRKNPPEPLFLSYPYPDPQQTVSLENGNLKIVLGSAGRLYWYFHPYPYLYPQGFAQGNLRSGTWSDAVNRLTFWAKPNHSLVNTGEWVMSVGTFVKPVTDTNPQNYGLHYYHSINPVWHANRWMKIVLSNKVQASNFNTGNTEFPIDPLYYSNLTAWYFGDNTSPGGAGPFPSGATWLFSPMEFSVVTNEPDNLVSSICACWSGSRYEAKWSGPKNVVQQYDVYWKTSSMKGTDPATSGTFAGTVATPGSAYTRVAWASAPMTELPDLYLAIRPRGQSLFTEVHLPQRA